MDVTDGDSTESGRRTRHRMLDVLVKLKLINKPALNNFKRLDRIVESRLSTVPGFGTHPGLRFSAAGSPSLSGWFDGSHGQCPAVTDGCADIQ